MVSIPKDRTRFQVTFEDRDDRDVRADLDLPHARRNWAVVVVPVMAIQAPASGQPKYKVWATDQSNSPGKTFGGTLYV